MPCPYAERRGPVVYCKAAGKIVNPLTHPCLSKTRYKKCKYYKQAEARKAQKAPETPAATATSEAREERQERPKPRILSIEPLPPRPEPPPPAPAEAAPPPPPAPAARQGGEPRTRGLTLDGRPARHCLECIYYGSRTRMCLLLGVEVKDPFNPPCAQS